MSAIPRRAVETQDVGAPERTPAEPGETGPTRQRLRRSRGLRLAAGTGVVLLLLFLVHVPLLTAVAGFLSIDDRLRPAGLIYVLGGEIDTRPFLAADLYRRGLAPRVVLARVADSRATQLGVMPNQTDATVRLLVRLGVPEHAIVVLRPWPAGVASTTDEAWAIRDLLRRSPSERMITVTSRYHTRRARWMLRRELEGVPVEILMAGAPHPEFSERNWWRSETGLLLVLEEYLKFAHNLIFR